MSKGTKESVGISRSVEKLKGLEVFVEHLEPSSLFVSEEQARALASEIEQAIPKQVRFLYPEDPLLAAIAYANIYYM